MSPSASAGHRIPAATYRLQFHHGFGLGPAREITGYLQELGISDCYASPLFRASPESLHGYDICDFARLNPALGTGEEFDQFTGELRERGMGLLLDLVPNHMGAHLANPMWFDVLQNGEASRYAYWFDIDWQAPGADGKVVLPILGEPYIEALEERKIKLAFDEIGFAIVYGARKFPLAPCSYERLLTELIQLVRNGSRSDQRAQELESPGAAFRPGAKCPISSTDFADLKRHCADRIQGDSQLREHLLMLLKDINRKEGSFDKLDALLTEQHYRLAYWRTGAEAINYRRFFDVTDLVSLRIELPQVFEATHELILRLVRKGQVTGLRIDHPDGLWNPKQYLDRLQEAIAGRNAAFMRQENIPDQSLPRERGDPDAVPGSRPIYLVVEKILTGDETLPADWPVDGTTGYDFLVRVNNLFVSRENRALFDAVYRDFTSKEIDFATVRYAGKKRILLTTFVSELNALTRRLSHLSSRIQSLTCEALRAALVEMIACFPVYRTYIDEKTWGLAEAERHYILEASRSASARVSGSVAEALGFVKEVLLLETASRSGREDRNSILELIMKFQQLTGPVMAKGVEDTAFYNFNRLISLNEVGGDPGCFGQEVPSFHAYNRLKSEQWPHSLLATATHDTKRGEDARARINVLSEIPQEWREALLRWRSLNERNKRLVDNYLAPAANDEYLFYQALLGAWTPDAETLGGLDQLRDRMSAYMLKAVRESKAHSSWVEPNRPYEEATARFVEQVLADRSDEGFVEQFTPFQHRVSFFGYFNSLSQTLLKMTAPGVPDFYQGSELWDLNLVDPDNRRAVDYVKRRRLLGDLTKSWSGNNDDRIQMIADLVRNPQSGQVKLFLIWRTLQFRRAHPGIFTNGRYVALPAAGIKQDHVVAFARSTDGAEIIVVVPRLVASLTNRIERPPVGAEVWQDTQLQLSDLKPGGPYQNIITEEQHVLSPSQANWPLAKVLSQFPVAVLARAV